MRIPVALNIIEAAGVTCERRQLGSKVISNDGNGVQGLRAAAKFYASGYLPESLPARYPH